jgi:hypothetical protein
VRRSTGGYGNNPHDGNDANFDQYTAAVQTIVTSGAQNDSGLFETNLRDERYLPFEGAGAISSWSLELLGKPRPFDYDTIADVILTIRYTARAEGSRASAEQAAEQWLKTNAARVFSMRHEFGSEWASFKHPIEANGGKASLKFTLGKEHFPYRLEKMMEPAKRLHVFFAGNASGDIELRRNTTTIGTNQLVNGVAFDQSPFPVTGDFELHFDSNALDDLWLVVDWSEEAE